MADEPIDDESTRWPIGLEQCPVCTDTFINGLRLQPACRHPICIACLRKIVNENTPNEKRCPVCREDFTHLADQLGDLPTAEYFDNLLSSSRDISEPSWPESPNLVGKPVICDWCPDNEEQSADWHCYQCCQFLCEKCFGRHKKGRCTNDHDVYRFEYILQVRVADDNYLFLQCKCMPACFWYIAAVGRFGSRVPDQTFLDAWIKYCMSSTVDNVDANGTTSPMHTWEQWKFDSRNFLDKFQAWHVNGLADFHNWYPLDNAFSTKD